MIGAFDDAAAQEGLSVRHHLPELEFVRPLPGFPELSRYVLVRLDETPATGDDPAATDGAAPDEGEAGDEGEPQDAVLYELRSVEQPDVRFLVGVPTAFFPEYAFDLDEASCAELGLETAEDALVLVILTIGDDSASTTANLLAPVVINARTRSAAQVILSGTAWPVRAAVV
ncbi:MAG TPA: flagellar assembly protein FliW [Kineosporiaceae bacterium]|nr:flagellar assembly protein FliW [Kineosporiaceae bacterium]